MRIHLSLKGDLLLPDLVCVMLYSMVILRSTLKLRSLILSTALNAIHDSHFYTMCIFT